MKAHLKFISIFSLLFLFAATNVFGQEKDTDKPVKTEKKIVIVKKVVDEDGNVKVEKIIKEGEKAENIELEDEDGNIFITKEIDGENAEEGKVKIMKFKGNSDEDGTMEIKVDVDDSGNEKRIKIIIDDEEGEPEIIEWRGEGDMPEELKKELAENNIFIHEGDSDGVQKLHFDDMDMDNGNKACLGVMIGKTKEVENSNGEETVTIEGETDQGVAILDIIAGSGAEEAGLLKDDIITAINGTTVASIEEVLSVLNTASPGESVAIAYLRNDQPAQVNATLKQCAAKANKKMIWIDKDGEELELDEDNDWEFEDENGNVRKKEKRIMIIKESKEDGEETTEEFTFEPVEIEKNTLDLAEIVLYPNPTDGKLNLSFRAPAAPTTIRIVDTAGKEVYVSELMDFDGNFQKEIHLGKAAKGTLLLTIQQGDKVFTEKILAQ